MMLGARTRPGVIAGVSGLVAIASAWMASVVLSGVATPGLWVLGILPFVGLFCGHLCRSRRESAPAREGALAGLIASQPFAVAQLLALVRGATGIDWALYTSQVGPEVANGVRGAIVPLTLLAGLLTLVVIYVICAAISSGCSAGYYYAWKARRG